LILQNAKEHLSQTPLAAVFLSHPKRVPLRQKRWSNRIAEKAVFAKYLQGKAFDLHIKWVRRNQ